MIDDATDQLPLAGIRVLALENFIAGPVASMWLADAGAEVVKIERPDGGDSSRSLPPFAERNGERRSISFLRANRNKLSVTLDLKSDEGRATFLQLVDVADVVLENLNPTAMQRLDLSVHVLRERNPELIYTAISGFGRREFGEAPLGDLTGFDVLGQAMGGLMWRAEGTGDRPRYLGFPITDIYAATLAVSGTYQALFKRARFGGGAYVDISLMDGAIALNELSLIVCSATGRVAPPGLHALTAPFGAYRARDGFVAIGVLGEAIWRRFTDAIGRPDLRERPEFATGVSRHENEAPLMEAVQPWLDARTVDEILAVFLRHGVPASRVNDVDDILRSEHAWARGMLMPIDDPIWGRVTMAGNPIKSTATPDTPPQPPPRLGADNEDVLDRWLSVGGAQRV